MSRFNQLKFFTFLLLISVFLFQCSEKQPKEIEQTESVVLTMEIKPDFVLTKDQTHNKFSSTISPILKVKSGTIIEAFTEDASDEQFKMNSGIEDLRKLDFEPIHPLTGPVFVENAVPGDVIKVTLHDIEVGDWGWNAIFPGFSFVADSIKGEYLRIYDLKNNKTTVNFNDSIELELKPFPGVMGVAPATTELLSTIPPRANGGNMDDPNMTVGTSVYFPVFVEGGLFSIGDGHAVQGLGEVCGTAIEVPLRNIINLNDAKIFNQSFPNLKAYAIVAHS
ncbi:acetamidase/formamidase family protein, partial [Winogradskyella sp.]|uniref:acetamidase/formamidase family protein n=1 Tax=Winogradskyella sp. TaxID=1883156 RepID=UPI0025D539B6